MTPPPIVHMLRHNGAAQAPFADFTLCGLAVCDDMSSMWPDETLRGVHWGKAYIVRGRWCSECKAVRKTGDVGEPHPSSYMYSSDCL